MDKPGRAGRGLRRVEGWGRVVMGQSMEDGLPPPQARPGHSSGPGGEEKNLRSWLTFCSDWSVGRAVGILRVCEQPGHREARGIWVASWRRRVSGTESREASSRSQASRLPGADKPRAVIAQLHVAVLGLQSWAGPLHLLPLSYLSSLTSSSPPPPLKACCGE